MRAFDLTQIEKFRDVFPELTNVQFETGMLLSLGLSQGEIAWLRDVSYPAVRIALSEIKERLDFHSINSLISMFQVRLVLYLLNECTIKIMESKK